MITKTDEIKKHENNFKFSLITGGNVIAERIFSADIYNQYLRYSVDIREKLPEIINRLVKVLSKKEVTTNLYGYNTVKLYNMAGYDNMAYYKKLNRSTGDNRMSKNKLNDFEIQELSYGSNNNKFSGVEFKFSLQLNENTIVERTFCVQYYNSESRFSLELCDTLNSIVEDIQNHLKKNDSINMWDEYDITNTYGIDRHIIRTFNKEKRETLLKNITDITYVDKIKRDFKVNTSNVEYETEEVAE